MRGAATLGFAFVLLAVGCRREARDRITAAPEHVPSSVPAKIETVDALIGHAGETVTVRQGLILRTLLVVGTPASRVGAKLVPNYCTDLTPESEFEKVRLQRLQHVLARAKGSGRPTKRERREVDRLFE
jgi:ribosome-associated heat shock protein Hsp15